MITQQQWREQLQEARFYGILDTGYLREDEILPKCKALLDGGADIIQLRAKGYSREDYRVLLWVIYDLFKDSSVPLIINDDLELALEFPRCGLHIGQDDVAVEVAREHLGPDRILGLSTHSVEQARGALEKADWLTYFCIGPVFPTQTKPDYIPVGLKLVGDVAALNQGRLPLFAIGGINRGNVAEVKAAGAQRVVVVSDVLMDPDSAEAVRQLKQAFRA